MGFEDDLLQINPYNPLAFRSSFERDPVNLNIPFWAHRVWARNGMYDQQHTNMHRTPRWRHMNGFVSMASFYYLGVVMESGPGSVADIGCGENFFKNFYGNIIGYDPYNDGADERAAFDNEFVRANASRFDAAFACNSIHFVGTEHIANRLGMLAAIVKPGGMVHATLNTRIVHAMSGIKTTDRDSMIATAMMIDSVIRSMNADWVVVDQCYETGDDVEIEFNNCILGNVRLVYRA